MSITDCDHICARCGEHMASCSLCRDMPPAVIKIRTAATYEAERAAERELDLQSRAIRRAADRRQGWDV